jgi:response regulator RpfG family c-di-GMP phosphodiesterase
MINPESGSEDYKILSSKNYSAESDVLKPIPDLVIADLTSIKKEKVELLMQLKNNPVISLVPFLLISSKKENQVFATGINKNEDQNQEQFSIHNYHLRKPFTKNDLHNSITKILDYMDGISPW